MKNKGICVSDIDEYNKQVKEDKEKLPKIVIIIDEISDILRTGEEKALN